MKEELKPCPFCGEEARLINKCAAFEKVSCVICTKCGARTKDFSISTKWSSDQEAIEAWNRRTEK